MQIIIHFYRCVYLSFANQIELSNQRIFQDVIIPQAKNTDYIHIIRILKQYSITITILSFLKKHILRIRTFYITQLRKCNCSHFSVALKTIVVLLIIFTLVPFYYCCSNNFWFSSVNNSKSKIV